MEKFSSDILLWYQTNKRDLPWRQTRNPYFIWLSEIILQQTRVEQGLPYYYRFVEEFPTVQSLASASEQEILRCWQGLGYYSRARNLHKCANNVVDNYHGEFPNTYKELLTLPGIGPYTAAAIASFAFHLPTAVADGNVFRLLSRYFGLSHDIGTQKGQEAFRKLANKLLPAEHSSNFNQGIMEFGALQCAPQPKCETCPLFTSCFARINNQQKQFPVKLKKQKSKSVHYSYFVFKRGDQLWMKKRLNNIWNSLYEFHLEENQVDDPMSILSSIGISSANVQSILEPVEATHLLSHRKIHAKFYLVELDKSHEWNEPSEAFANYYSLEEIEHLPKPKLIENYLNEKMPLKAE